MSLFSKPKDRAVQSFTLKLVNNNCLGRTTTLEGARADSRVNLVVVVMVIPMVDGKPQVTKTFMAVTKEFSSTGVAIVLDAARQVDEAVLGFRFEGDMTFIRAKAKHMDPLGGGFRQLGFHLQEVLSAGDYPELASMSF